MFQVEKIIKIFCIFFIIIISIQLIRWYVIYGFSEFEFNCWGRIRRIRRKRFQEYEPWKEYFSKYSPESVLMWRCWYYYPKFLAPWSDYRWYEMMNPALVWWDWFTFESKYLKPKYKNSNWNIILTNTRLLRIFPTFLKVILYTRAEVNYYINELIFFYLATNPKIKFHIKVFESYAETKEAMENLSYDSEYFISNIITIFMLPFRSIVYWEDFRSCEIIVFSDLNDYYIYITKLTHNELRFVDRRTILFMQTKLFKLRLAYDGLYNCIKPADIAWKRYAHNFET